MDISWREKYQQEDEDKALAMAMELSRKEHEQKQPATATSQHGHVDQHSSVRSYDEDEGLSRALAQSALDVPPKFHSKGAGKSSKGHVKHTALGGGVPGPQTGGRMAIPLCLPNNCTWNSKTSQYGQTGEKRRSLYVVEKALEKLRRIKGPVCVVSIAGPYRKGKSYVLGQAFDQAEVFPLGHHMDPETMGIWLWIVPGKFTDSRGQEFTVVLLDSEGIDSVTGEGLDDNQIFTLTVLLASVLIYNSQGVPTRRDLEGLEFIVKLSQRIEVRSKTGKVTGKVHRDSEYFHKTFPFFIWLLRDVAQEIPPDCHNIKDYFLKKVFKVHDSSATTQEGQKVAESILRFFPGFEAFMLPSPTVDPEKLKSINDNKSQINPKFFSGLEEFKNLLGTVLTPKNSINNGEMVTGEGLAALVEFYVQAINTPGVIPNVQNAWETFVEMKSSEAIKGGVEKYETVMTSQLKDNLPCDNDELRKIHGIAFENSEGYFMTETVGISTNTTETYLNKLKELLGEKLKAWQAKNEKSTREFCNDLLIQLKQSHLDPLLKQLQGKEGAKMSFEEIIGGYNRIKENYHNSAIGAKDVIAAVFFEFHPALMKEQEQYLGLLGQLKDYDEALTEELAAKAYQEQERQRLEEQQERLRQENLAVKKEMEMLGRKQNEERENFRKQMDSELKAQKEQMDNMMEANMEQARKEREAFMQENKDLKSQFLDIQKANEDNIKMIEKLSALVAKQEKEKQRLNEEMEKAQRAQATREREELIAKMEARHKEQQEELRREMLAKMEAHRKTVAQEYQQAAAQARMEKMEEMQEKLDTVERELEEVRKPNFIQKAWSKVKEVGSAIGEAVVDVGTAVAKKVKDNCSVM